MEYVDGTSLTQIIESHVNTNAITEPIIAYVCQKVLFTFFFSPCFIQ